MALARIWRVYTIEVEAFLESEPKLLMGMYEVIQQEVHGELSNLAGQGSVTAIVFIPAALPGLIKLLQKILIERLNLISIWMIVNLFLAKFANWGIAR